MKYVDEFRDPSRAVLITEELKKITTKKWTLMEICGGQTHSILRYGIDELIPKNIELIHGPGCPVCVTPIKKIDLAIELSLLPNIILCSYGDMLRVPGNSIDLFTAKAKGADVRIVYSPLDAVKIAKDNPKKEVVFFAVGFETTAPANAMSVIQAVKENITNYSLLVSHVLVPPAMEEILKSPNNRVQGFLAAGHVCTIMGIDEYFPLSLKYKIPIIVTGFEPLDLLEGIYLCVKQLEHSEYKVENQYARSVKTHGNPKAREIMEDIFEINTCEWRGIGEIKNSGLQIKEKYKSYDAEKKFNVISKEKYSQNSLCESGLVLQGQIKPPQCKQFAKGCTPETPLGATMVSSEGACAAYYRYRNITENLEVTL